MRSLIFLNFFLIPSIHNYFCQFLFDHFLKSLIHPSVCKNKQMHLSDFYLPCFLTQIMQHTISNVLKLPCSLFILPGVLSLLTLRNPYLFFFMITLKFHTSKLLIIQSVQFDYSYSSAIVDNPDMSNHIYYIILLLWGYTFKVDC